MDRIREFKGTGNSEIRLRREFAEKRIFPAIDVDASSTRREELLMSREELAIVWKLRRVLSGLESLQGLEMLLDRLRKTQSNAEFLMAITKTIPSQDSCDHSATGLAWQGSRPLLPSGCLLHGTKAESLAVGYLVPPVGLRQNHSLVPVHAVSAECVATRRP
jgi:hypothetical protein